MEPQVKKKTPDPSQKSLHTFFKTSASSKENTPHNENVNANSNVAAPTVKSNLKETTASVPLAGNKRYMYQCDYCREATFDTMDEAVIHEETCHARKPAAKESKVKETDSKDKEKKAAKKRKRKSKIPDPQGTITVNVPFNDGTLEVKIDGVCTNVFEDSIQPVTLDGEYPVQSKRAIKNFLSGFGKFVW